MKDSWSDDDAARHSGPLGECVYCTRLIGSDPDLVLHGGGNSSVKLDHRDITGKTLEALYVKGSGWDMGSIEAPGFTPLPLGRMLDLLELEALSDPDMMREFGAARLDPAAPAPSVETLLHAYLPFRAVQHSHADCIVSLTNLEGGDAVVREVYGDDVVVVPYVMPGFDLARAVRKLWSESSHSGTVGMVLLNHGLFTFGDDSKQAYRRHLELINRAEVWLHSKVPPADRKQPGLLPEALLTDLASLRHQLSEAAGAPLIVSRHTGPVVRGFVARDDLGSLASRGPLTPDHVIRTKRAPLVGRDVGRYVAEYQAEFERLRSRREGDLTMLDPAPRVVLDPELGMLAVGRSAKDAGIVADIYHHTMPVLERSEDFLGGYRALDPGDLFDVEYWDLEQAKLRAAGAKPELVGTVAVVTGAASGIGRACAQALLAAGSAVVGIDRDRAIESQLDGASSVGVAGDVTDPEVHQRALRAGVERFGGIDIAILAAGVFGGSARLADHSADEWRSVMAVNVDAAADLLKRLHPLLRLSPVGGRVTLVGSKNVPAPGNGAGSYSASKAALTQLGRVAALEWAGDGIRVNLLHPDGVFDTGLWSDELLQQRAESYGISVEEYKRRNLLGVEISSADVAKLAVALCTDLFAATTGAQIPIDGGNERVI